MTTLQHSTDLCIQKKCHITHA